MIIENFSMSDLLNNVSIWKPVSVTTCGENDLLVRFHAKIAKEAEEDAILCVQTYD